ncbi:MAG: glycosyltransferase family 4 protein [Gammaproteobacteria bacterium]|jgi:glycosyltransferase involved in cell wall biosynthesis|nr:glycosyltransferase family 4 protein [Gammaproteobacteria bacterium]MBQ0774128.1 glycosyltransferase family 4 protein [Gammaproteobacteria bacterium]
MTLPKKFLLMASYADSLITFRGHLIDSLIAAGLEVHIAVPIDCSYEVVRTLESKGVVVHNIPLRRTGLNPILDLFALLYLVKLMMALKPEYVLAYTIKPVVYGLIAARICSIRNRFALITGLGYAFESDQQGILRKYLKKLVVSLYRYSLGGADIVFFQNSDDEALFRSSGILHAKVPSRVVNGSGVDLLYYQYSPAVEEPLRFLMIARLLKAKGIREYVDAARKVRAFRQDVVFDLVGWLDDGPDAISKNELDSWIEEDAINYLGKLSDVRPAISRCSVYVLPSYREGTPRTVLEAMSMGRPVITTDAPGCSETVIEGVNGYLVPVRSVSALRNAMELFINNPSSVADMGKQSRRIAEEKYDVHKVNEVMLTEMGIS